MGPAIPREGDYFGPFVNLLSRLVKVGGPGELVATEAAVKDVAARSAWVSRRARAGRRAVDVPGPVRRRLRVEPKGPAPRQTGPSAPIG